MLQLGRALLSSQRRPMRQASDRLPKGRELWSHAFGGHSEMAAQDPRSRVSPLLRALTCAQVRLRADVEACQ